MDSGTGIGDSHGRVRWGMGFVRIMIHDHDVYMELRFSRI